MNSIAKKKHERHGLDTASSEYRTWIEMHRRCRISNRAESKRYAERGIKVCERWSKFSVFIQDIGKKPTTQHSIERIDNNGDYEPSNCRWATPKEQNNNRRTNHLIKINGKTKTIQQWCDKYNIPDTTFHNRLRRGWTGDKLISKKDYRYRPGIGGRNQAL